MTVNRLAAVLLVAGVLVACSANTPGTASSDSIGPRTAVVDDPNPEPVVDDPAEVLPVTVTGFDGVPVTVTDNSRIVAADQYGTLAETVFALGLGDNLVGRDTSAAIPAAENVPDVTPTGHSLSAEGILALSPTVVLTDTSIGPRAVQDQIRAAGIPLVYFDPTRT
ncbi:ABC transporter substrate-binding protein, partial [Rhodococcus sp. EPR-279]